MSKKEHITKGINLWIKIESCRDLKLLEIRGFIRGEEKGKTIDVPLEKVFQSLKKQWEDLETTYFKYGSFYPSKLKKCIADLRNVAGCLFLKLLELEKNG